MNKFGKGRAIYVAATAQPSGLLCRSVYGELGIARGPQTPKGVAARLVDGRTLYVNTTDAPVDVKIAGARKGRITGKSWDGTVRLDGYGVELVD